MKRLDVAVYGTLVGSLTHGHHENYSFTPDGQWLAARQLPLLSLNFYQRPEPWRSTHVPVWFENMLPERKSELRRLLCSGLGLRDGQSMALLQALGTELPGAVVLTGDSPPSDAPEDAAPDSPKLGGMRFSSLAGVQLKFSMAKRGTRFVLPLTGADSEWIVKIPDLDMLLLPGVEHATMAWAADMGFSVPEHSVVNTSDLEGLEKFVSRGLSQAFAIRRYDRAENGTRVHQEDLAQVLNLDPSHKYGDGSIKGINLDAIARIVQDACEPSALEDLIERFAFVIASGNTDAHLKNWSFVYDRNSAVPKLSPCYDQVCTIAVDAGKFGWESQEPPKLALSLGGEKRLRAFGGVHLQRLMDRLGDTGALKARFLAAIERARDTWSEVAELAPPEMHQALERHWREVPLLDHVGGWKA